MLTNRQQNQTFAKLKRFEKTLEHLMFRKVDEISMSYFKSDDSWHSVPPMEHFSPCRDELRWNEEGIYCWFRGTYQVPESLNGQTLFLYPDVEAYEGLVWIDGVPYGNMASKIARNSHGNHYCVMLKKDAAQGQDIEVALEYYAHHLVQGTQPLTPEPEDDYEIVFRSINICVKNEPVWDVYFDLHIVNQMVESLEENSFRRAKLIQALMEVHKILYYDYENTEKPMFYEALAKAHEILKRCLQSTNSDSAPYAGLIGHSHMDTAWLWHIAETEKKCARTFSNQINLMDQYPDYTFVQSSAYHGAMMLRKYPELFERIKEKAAEGRYEPNGGVWIESDCNIPSGEYMIRQFLWGQRFTREHFGYTSDSFWLPDTFGYSVSLPQIMKGCGIDYFLTTKIGWNDTTEFPYETFYWKGLDGTKVLVHFNKTHIWPNPANLLEYVKDSKDNAIKEKTVSDMRLLSYGFGDGGGGPEFEMVELANRLQDVEGLPKSAHTTVGAFMKQLEERIQDPSVYSGELYLELHRGTLTNQHTIKRNNRLAEIGLHNLELVTVQDAVRRQAEASGEAINPLTETLLVNQFHDILPGTSIPRVHRESREQTTALIESAAEQTADIQESWAVSAAEQEAEIVTVSNPVSFDRSDVLYLDDRQGKVIAGDYRQQRVTDLEGHTYLAVADVKQPGLGSITLEYCPGQIAQESAFQYEGNVLNTPYYEVLFNDKGYMEQLIDIEEDREIRGEGYALNTLLIGEDVSAGWDSWDIDADIEYKMGDRAGLISREVVSDGAVEFRIRSKYQLTPKSVLEQDMIFYSDSREIRFETIMDWQDDHCLLKTAFDTTIFTDYVRQEVQFGHIKRRVSRNTAEEKARFEVSNHKFSDLSETRYGAALLNDCKYGIGVKDSQMRLTLHKGGCLPDFEGDKGIHKCCYSFLPHTGGFSAENVVHPAYQLNYKPLITAGKLQQKPLIWIQKGNIIAETIKPSEDGGRSYILRLYEAEGTHTRTRIRFEHPLEQVTTVNMLEESFEGSEELTLKKDNRTTVTLRPFEIMTLKVEY